MYSSDIVRVAAATVRAVEMKTAMTVLGGVGGYKEAWGRVSTLFTFQGGWQRVHRGQAY